MIENKSLDIGYFKGLDILRFIAASCVVLHHASKFLGNKGFDLNAAKYHYYSGSFFLDLFFVISGFLIALILFKELDANQFNLKKFFLRRILRIWPLFFFIIIARVVIFSLAKGVPANEVLYNLSFAATFTTNFQLIFGQYFDSTYKILWSVCIEEHIYLIFPFMVLLFRKTRYFLVLLFVLVGLISLNFTDELFTSNSNLSVPYFMSTSYLYYFGIGCFLALLFSNQPNFFQKLSAIITHWIVQLIILSLGFLLVFNVPFEQEYPVWFLISLNGLFASYLVFCAISGNLLIDKLGMKTSRLLGNISYAMYLIHPMLLGASFKIVIGKSLEVSLKKLNFGFPLFAILLTMIVSTLLYFIVERPFLKLKKKYAVVKGK